MNADKVIEWVTHVMGVMLTSTQKDLLRMHFGEPIAHDRTRHDWAAGGRKFARLMADAYREAQQVTHFSACKVGQTVNEPFDDGHSYTCDMGNGTYLVAHRQGPSREVSPGELMDRELDHADYQRRFAATVVEAQNKLEMLHGHGPATVEWETDFRETPSKGRVYMPFKEGCAVCVALHRVEKLREDNDG